ncbi:MAG: hypothetical protein HQL51_00075 [Magnetococcales bacterium]|nr:hypothetical protein [Magnetococcales bacterium]
MTSNGTFSLWRGFLLFAAGLAGLAAWAFVSVHDMQTRLAGGRQFSTLLNLTLEIRRYENNYFLYRHKNDFSSALDYVDLAQRRLAEMGRSLEEAGEKEVQSLLDPPLNHYRALFQELPQKLAANPAAESTLEGELHLISRALIKTAERLVNDHQTREDKALSVFRGTVGAISLLLLALVGWAGWRLHHHVTRPLDELRDALARVARGELPRLPESPAPSLAAPLTAEINRLLNFAEQRQEARLRPLKSAAVAAALGEISRETGDPLGNISTSCQILLEEPGLDPTQREMLTRIDQQAEFTRLLLERLPPWLEQEGMDPQPAALDELIREALATARGHLPPGVSLGVECPEGLVVITRPGMLPPIWIHLIERAGARGGGGGSVILRGRRISPTPGDHSALGEGPRREGVEAAFIAHRARSRENGPISRVAPGGAGEEDAAREEVMLRVWRRLLRRQDVTLEARRDDGGETVLLRWPGTPTG